MRGSSDTSSLLWFDLFLLHRVENARQFGFRGDGQARFFGRADHDDAILVGKPFPDQAVDFFGLDARQQFLE